MYKSKHEPVAPRKSLSSSSSETLTRLSYHPPIPLGECDHRLQRFRPTPTFDQKNFPTAVGVFYFRIRSNFQLLKMNFTVGKFFRRRSESSTFGSEQKTELTEHPYCHHRQAIATPLRIFRYSLNQEKKIVPNQIPIACSTLVCVSCSTCQQFDLSHSRVIAIVWQYIIIWIYYIHILFNFCRFCQWQCKFECEPTMFYCMKKQSDCELLRF